MCNKVLDVAFGGKLFKFLLFSLGFLCFFTPPPPCVSMHLFTTPSVILAMGFVGQEKVACA